MKRYQKLIHLEIFTLEFPDHKSYVIMVLDEMDEVIGNMVAHPGKWHVLIGKDNDNIPVCLN